MKKTIKLLSLLLILCFMSIFALAVTSCGQDQWKGKNLIYVIGDGMGVNHIANAKLYMEKDKLDFESYYVGEVTTRSANSAVTDSAAAATALATGVKTNNDYVGIDKDGKELQNIMELSKRQGKKTGVVTTDTLNGATPAGFSAHAEHRDNTYDIIMSQKKGYVDLFMGKYESSYNLYKEDFTDKNFGYAENLTELNGLDKSKKVLANIKNVDSTYNPDKTDAVPLKTLVEYALGYLAGDDKGFTLMVEGAYIDKHSHNNDLQLMIYALMDLNDAVNYILDWASNRDDTVVIFTADHETGALNKAENKDALADSLYTSTSHSAANVSLYLYNTTTTITNFDNVDVYKIAEQVVLYKGAVA